MVQHRNDDVVVFITHKSPITLCTSVNNNNVNNNNTTIMSTLTSRVKRAASALATTTNARVAKKPLRRHVTVEYESSPGADTKSTTATTNVTAAIAPDRWEETWSELQVMRAKHPAPVDSMGCDSFYNVAAVQKRHPEVANEADAARMARFRVLVSLMLSSQTKDTENAKAMQRLIEWGLTVDRVCDVPDDAELNAMIANVGFHNKKGRLYLKRPPRFSRSASPRTFPRRSTTSLSLPGVGMKMAHLALQSAWNVTIGISVDTHVHRISARLGWTKNAKTPGQTAEQLEAWLPHRYWHEINHTLVGHG
jgi:endonuclease-3